MNKISLSPSHFLLRSILLFATCALIFLTGVHSAGADGAPPPEPDMGGVAPYKPIETNVQMMSETVLIDVLSHPTRWINSELNSDSNHIKVRASFTLRNQGKTEEKMQVIFPLTRLDYPWLTSSYGIISESFVAKVNGQSVSTTGLSTPPELQALPENLDSTLPDGSFLPDVQWAGFEVAFPVQTDVIVEVEYDMRGDYMAGLHHVDYILETGAGWYGRILSADFIVRLPYPASSESVPQTPAGCGFSGNEVQCKMENFEPKRKDNLSFGFIDTNEWPPILELRSRVEQYPDDAEAWYQLGKKYDSLGFGWGEIIAMSDEHMVELAIEAYERVITLRPDWVGAHSRLASDLWFHRMLGDRSGNLAKKKLSAQDPVIQRVVEELKLISSYGRSDDYLVAEIRRAIPDLELSLPAPVTVTPVPTIPAATPGAMSNSLDRVVAIAVGNYHTCVLTPSEVKCQGSNLENKMVGDFKGVVAGDFYTCVLTKNGGVQCMGKNNFGQLGDGTTTDREALVDVMGLTNGVASLVAGDNHTCALMTSGGVKCWGRNYFGQLGNGTTAYSLLPVEVHGLTTGVTRLVAGSDHTCAVLLAGRIKCWGANESGQLGDGSLVNRLAPVDVVGLPDNVTALAAGFAHTCALDSQGQATCWGDNSHGQLGGGDTAVHTTPVTVAGLDVGIAKIAAGNGYTCALANKGGVKCWGRNDFSQVDYATNVDSSTPVDVMGLGSGVVDIAAGNNHNCALLQNARVACWGMTNYAYRGLEAHHVVQFESTPAPVSEAASFTPVILSTPAPAETFSPVTDLVGDLVLLIAISGIALLYRRSKIARRKAE